MKAPLWMRRWIISERDLAIREFINIIYEIYIKFIGACFTWGINLVKTLKKCAVLQGFLLICLGIRSKINTVV